MKITKLTHILFIALIILIVFSPSLKNDFAWDDSYLIINNPYIKNWNYIQDIFKKQLYDGGEMESNFYRPIQLLSFAIDYSIWKLNPFGYHLTNLLLHIFNSILIYLIISIISSSASIAFIAALMFGLSPVISGVVYYISARSDLLMALFMFLSVLFFIAYKERKKSIFYIFSIMAFIFSLLCKEMAIILPFLLVIEAFRNSMKREAIKSLSPYFIVLFVYIFLRMSVLNFAKGTNIFIDYSFPATIPLWKRLLTDFNVVVTYLRFLLFPFNLRMERFTEPAKGLFEIGVLLSVALIIFLIALIRRLSRSDRIFLYGAIWFFISLLPVLNIYPISVFLHEMWLYLPSVGFFIFFAAFIVRIIDKKVSKFATILFVTLYVSYYSLVSVLYGKTWKDSISLFHNILKYEVNTPFIYLMYNNLAMAYYDKKDFEKSIEYCKKSIALEPEYAEPYNNLGVTYVAVGKPFKAIKYFKKAISLKRNYVSSYCNLSHIYNNIGLKDKAAKLSMAAIRLDPCSYKVYCNLGYIYSDKGDIDTGIKFFRRAIELRREEGEPYYCLGNLYIKKNRFKEALDAYEKALRLGLVDYSFYNEIAFLYIKNKKFKKAEMALRQSIILNNNQSEPYNNLGNLYSMFGYFDIAMKEYKKALSIAPDSINIWDNLRKTKFEWKNALSNSMKHGKAVRIGYNTESFLQGR